MEHMLFAKQLGQLIKDKRKALGYSQEGFADFIGVHRTYVGCIERAEQNITLRNLLKLSDGLGLNLSDLIRDVERTIEKK